MMANCGNILLPCTYANYMLSLTHAICYLRGRLYTYGYSENSTARALKSNNIFEKQIIEKSKKSKAERANKDV